MSEKISNGKWTKKEDNLFNLGPDHITVKMSNVVKLYEFFSLHTEKGSYDLKAEISADFFGIPEEYHEVFLNMLTSKYLNKVSFGDNPFSECKPYRKKKWWEFWKITK